MKIGPNTPKIGIMLVLLIWVGKSIQHKWVNIFQYAASDTQENDIQEFVSPREKATAHKKENILDGKHMFIKTSILICLYMGGSRIFRGPDNGLF